MELIRFDRRPWGSMVKLIHTKHFWLKCIVVHGRTSLQSHSRRTEYHLGTTGIKKVVPGKIHRMTRGIYLEIAVGDPQEEDITRYEDDYGRS